MNTSTLTDQIDALTESAFWAGEDLDAITDALLASWLEVKTTRYSSSEIVAALHRAADDLSKSTYH
jgi:transcriptional regulator